MKKDPYALTQDGPTFFRSISKAEVEVLRAQLDAYRKSVGEQTPKPKSKPKRGKR